MAVVGTALAVGAFGCASTPNLNWNAPGIDQCQKSIQRVAETVRRRIFDAAQRCTDGYRAAAVDGDTLAVTALRCENALKKTMFFPDPSGESAMAKAKSKLDEMAAAGHCSDSHLVGLGMLPTATFGDKWARLVLINALQSAVNEQSGFMRDSNNIFQELRDSGACPSCNALLKPPCVEHTCRLSSDSKLDFGPAPAISGTVGLGVCHNPGILGNDFGIITGPVTQPLVPAGVMATLCTQVVGASGYITRNGSVSPQVDTATCQDSLIESPDSDECPAALGGAPICALPTTDLGNPLTQDAGPCLRLSPTVSMPGSSFVLGAVRITRVASSGFSGDERGVDGMPCTYDDTAVPGASVLVPLTTGTVSTALIDVDDVDGGMYQGALANSSETGALFTQVEGGSLSGGRWVAGISAASTIQGTITPGLYLDAMAHVILDCE